MEPNFVSSQCPYCIYDTDCETQDDFIYRHEFTSSVYRNAEGCFMCSKFEKEGE